MARTALVRTPIPADDNGLRLDVIAGGVVAADVVNGNVYDANDLSLLWVHNADVGAQNVTFTATFEGISVTKIIAFAAGQRSFFNFDVSFWGRHGAVDGGKVYVDSASANVRLCAIQG